MERRDTLWIASYPKSGNTWVASILEAAGRRHGYPQGGYDTYSLQLTGEVPQVCPAVAPHLSDSCSVLKTHSPFFAEGLPHTLGRIKPLSIGFIHIYRNPLDILLSYIGFTRIEYKHKLDNAQYQRLLFLDLLGYRSPIDYTQWLEMGIDNLPRGRLDHALDHFSENGLAIATLMPMAGNWIDHLRSWQSAMGSLPSHSIRYEDCIANPDQFSRLHDMFVFGPRAISAAATRIKAQTETMALRGSARDRIFFNKRDSYYFREYFSADAIDRFCCRHESLLKEAGYECLLEPGGLK